METSQPTTPPVYVKPATTAVFGTKIPSTVAFAIGILLFFLPFIDIKCNNVSLQQVSGFQLATGFKVNNKSSDNSFLNDVKTNKADETITKTTTKSDKKDPNTYALIGLGLGVLGLLLSFASAKAASGGAMITGVASAVALIGLMIDIKKKVKMDAPSTGKSDDDVLGLNKIGQQMSDNINIRVEFTPWFYIAIIAFLAAAVFCYMRMRNKQPT